MNKIDAIMLLSDAMQELEHVQICNSEIMEKFEKVYDWLHEVTDTDLQPTLQLISDEMERIEMNQRRIDRKYLDLNFGKEVLLRTKRMQEQREEQKKRNQIQQELNDLPF